MKISYDEVGSGNLYPLSKQDVERIRDALPSEIVKVIGGIKFACNTMTTQEGRVVKRGRLYEIRVDFPLTRVGDHLQSRLLSVGRRYLDEVRRYGGKPDLRTRVIHWDLEHAKWYAHYVLLHEIGHVVYLERYAGGRPVGKAHAKEETWCDDFSAVWVERLVAGG